VHHRSDECTLVSDARFWLTNVYTRTTSRIKRFEVVEVPQFSSARRWKDFRATHSHNREIYERQTVTTILWKSPYPQIEKNCLTHNLLAYLFLYLGAYLCFGGAYLCFDLRIRKYLKIRCCPTYRRIKQDIHLPAVQLTKKDIHRVVHHSLLRGGTPWPSGIGRG